MTYGNVYVAQVALGSNPNHLITALKEAEKHKGPSLIIAYAPCINHGLVSGMGKVQNEEKLAVECGYWPLWRYIPENKEQGKNPPPSPEPSPTVQKSSSPKPRNSPRNVISSTRNSPERHNSQQNQHQPLPLRRRLVLRLIVLLLFFRLHFLQGFYSPIRVRQHGTPYSNQIRSFFLQKFFRFLCRCNTASQQYSSENHPGSVLSCIVKLHSPPEISSRSAPAFAKMRLASGISSILLPPSM